MTKHLCSTCHHELPASAFATSILSKKSKTCRECRSAYNRRWYELNRDDCLQRSRIDGQRKKSEADEVIRKLKDRPCADCGGRFPTVAMDFDHVRGEKLTIIAKLRGRSFSLERLLAEVAKCEVVCANCHRVRTARRIEESGKRVYWRGKEHDEPGT